MTWSARGSQDPLLSANSALHGGSYYRRPILDRYLSIFEKLTAAAAAAVAETALKDALKQVLSCCCRYKKASNK